MAEYIDREEAKVWIANAISFIPSTDVQPVVRCNECNLYDGAHEVHGFASCDYWMQMTRWDDYCSHGVRTDGEDNG